MGCLISRLRFSGCFVLFCGIIGVNLHYRCHFRRTDFMDHNDNRLTKDAIKDHRFWNLSLKISDSALDIALRSTVEDNSLILRHFDSAATSVSKALEEAVYDNPLLLCDFGRTDVVVDCPRLAFVPDYIAGDSDRLEKAASMLWPGDGTGKLIANNIARVGAALIMKLDSDIAGLIARTFNNPPVYHRLTPLCRYYSFQSRAVNNIKLFVNLSDDTVDIVAFSNDGMLLANTFRTTTVADALYYSLAVARICGFDQLNDEIMLSGDRTTRDSLTPLLRQYVNYVMPLIFPSDVYRHGKESLAAPFELIILPLCE